MVEPSTAGELGASVFLFQRFCDVAKVVIIH